MEQLFTTPMIAYTNRIGSKVDEQEDNKDGNRGWPLWINGTKRQCYTRNAIRSKLSSTFRHVCVVMKRG